MVELASAVFGDSSGQHMVLLHGLGGVSSSWAPVAPELNASYTVTALDFPGHGQSEHQQVYTMELLRDSVLNAIDQLNPQVTADNPAVLVGHSLGGAVALLCVVERPELFSHLIIEDSYLPNEISTPLRERPPGDLPFDWEAIKQLVSAVHDPARSLWPRLRDVAVPTLVLAGGPSSTAAQDLVQETAQLIPHSHYVTIDAGHHIHRDAPHKFIDTVLNWLRDTPARAHPPS